MAFVKSLSFFDFDLLSIAGCLLIFRKIKSMGDHQLCSHNLFLSTHRLSLETFPSASNTNTFFFVIHRLHWRI